MYSLFNAPTHNIDKSCDCGRESFDLYFPQRRLMTGRPIIWKLGEGWLLRVWSTLLHVCGKSTGMVNRTDLLFHHCAVNFQLIFLSGLISAQRFILENDSYAGLTCSKRKIYVTILSNELHIRFKLFANNKICLIQIGRILLSNAELRLTHNVFICIVTLICTVFSIIEPKCSY